jgi:hypothetical protein
MQQGRTQYLMQETQDLTISTQHLSAEWTKLIRKLRWIGLEDDAHNLELALSTLPAEQRGGISAEPYGTD